MKPSLALLLVALSVVAAGCRDNDASIEIFALCGPPDDPVECSTSGTCDMVLASPRPHVFTTVDGNVNRFDQYVQMNNQLPPNGDLALGRLNTNDFIGGEYLLSFRGFPNLPDMVVPANFTIPAGASATPIVTVIPMATMLQIRAGLAPGAGATVIAELKVRGNLVDGTEIETGEFEIAVDVINADFVTPTCPEAGQVAFFCPNRLGGQTASFVCEVP